MKTDNPVGITVGEMKGLRADFEGKLSGSDGRMWLEAFKHFLKKENPWQVVTEGTNVVVKKTTDLLRFLVRTQVSYTPETETSKALTSARFYPAQNPQLWFSPHQLRGESKYLAVWELKTGMTFRQVARAVLGVDKGGIKVLTKGLRAGGHTVVLSQIEALVDAHGAGNATGLGSEEADSFFVEGKDGELLVVELRKMEDGRWATHISGFYETNLRKPGQRFFVRDI